MSARKAEIVEKATGIAERIARSEGLELVEVEWKGGKRGILRIFIDKPGGVTHADCETVSKQMSVILDVEEVVPADSYHLEVSSPGLDRKLLKLSDYERFAGKKANVKLRNPLGGRQQYIGVLGGVEEGRIVIEPKPGERVTFALDDVKQSRLVVEI